MDPAWTEFGEGEPVLGRPVPSVTSEPVAAVGLGEGAHRAVREAAPGARLQRVESPTQGFAVRHSDAVTIDPPGWVGYYRDGLGPAEQRAEDFLPHRGPQQFGVVDPGDLGVTEDYGRGHQRSGQSATSRLIGTGQWPAATQHPCCVESVERTLLRRKAGRVSL